MEPRLSRSRTVTSRNEEKTSPLAPAGKSQLGISPPEAAPISRVITRRFIISTSSCARARPAAAGHCPFLGRMVPSDRVSKTGGGEACRGQEPTAAHHTVGNLRHKAGWSEESCNPQRHYQDFTARYSKSD